MASQFIFMGLLVFLSLFIVVAGGGTSDSIRFTGTKANSGDTTGSDIGLRAVLLSNLAYVTNPDDTIYNWANSLNICSKCPACAQLGLATSIPIRREFFVAGGEDRGPRLVFLIVPFPTYTAIIFRGSKSDAQWDDNFNAIRKKYGGCKDCYMHSGFYEAYSSGASELLGHLNSLHAHSQGTPLFITGHSQGGAQATIAAFELAVLGFNVAGVASVASPRVGNAAYAAKWNTRVGDGVGTPEPNRGVPFIIRNLEENFLHHMGKFDETDGVMRPSALLLAAAAEICGFCGGLHDPKLNASATKALWNAHVAGRILPTSQGRRMYGANLGTSGKFPLGAWRIASVADPAPLLPPATFGFYGHVATHVLLAANTPANSGSSVDMENPSLRKIFIKAGNDWDADFATTERSLYHSFFLFDKKRHDLDEYAYRLTPSAFLNGKGFSSVKGVVSTASAFLVDNKQYTFPGESFDCSMVLPSVNIISLSKPLLFNPSVYPVGSPITFSWDSVGDADDFTICLYLAPSTQASICSASGISSPYTFILPFTLSPGYYAVNVIFYSSTIRQWSISPYFPSTFYVSIAYPVFDILYLTGPFADDSSIPAGSSIKMYFSTYNAPISPQAILFEIGAPTGTFLGGPVDIYKTNVSLILPSSTPPGSYRIAVQYPGSSGSILSSLYSGTFTVSAPAPSVSISSLTSTVTPGGSLSVSWSSQNGASSFQVVCYNFLNYFESSIGVTSPTTFTVPLNTLPGDYFVYIAFSVPSSGYSPLSSSFTVRVVAPSFSPTPSSSPTPTLLSASPSPSPTLGLASISSSPLAVASFYYFSFSLLGGFTSEPDSTTASAAAKALPAIIASVANAAAPGAALAPGDVYVYRARNTRGDLLFSAPGWRRAEQLGLNFAFSVRGGAPGGRAAAAALSDTSTSGAALRTAMAAPGSGMPASVRAAAGSGQLQLFTHGMGDGMALGSSGLSGGGGSTSSSTALSDGAIAGIVIAAILLLIPAIWWCCFRNKGKVQPVGRPVGAFQPPATGLQLRESRGGGGGGGTSGTGANTTVVAPVVVQPVVAPVVVQPPQPALGVPLSPWIRHLDVSSGRPYWENRGTGLTTWEPPPSGGGGSAEPPQRTERPFASTPRLPRGESLGRGQPRPAMANPWQMYVDANTGRPYWHNTNTQETSWKAPAEPASSEAGQGFQFTREHAWKRYQDPSSGKSYYFNASTQETRWA